MRLGVPFLALFGLALSLPLPARSGTIDIALPTDNDAIYRGDGPEFYMYVDRDYRGEKSYPWQGGQYGFVRDPMGGVFTRFHEGIDIKPVHRDANNEPLDEVRAIGAGKVVHVNPVAGHSNYGRYVVIEHNWGGSNYYSLYGHLNTISAKVGQAVAKGTPLGILGYTGVGINKTRAHLHLELNLMLNHRFEKWHDAGFPDPNYNGLYNGLNLQGIDIARLYLALRKNPDLTIPEFLEGEETFYKVALPRSSHFEWPRRYGWLVRQTTGLRTRSWEVSFNRAGVPLKIEPSDREVRQPEVTYAKKTSVDLRHLTKGDVTGSSRNPKLSTSGMRLMHLLIYPD